MNANHYFVDGSTNHSSYMREEPGNPEPEVSSLDMGQGIEMNYIHDMLKILTLKESFHPARRVSSRGEKSLAGLTAAPAVRPKL